jgi:hypothetical protein
MRMKLLLSVMLSTVVAASAARAEPEPDRDWQGTIGVRAALIKDRGFDPFSERDAFAQLSVGVSRVLLRQGPLAFAAGAALDTGSSEAAARSAQAHLDLDRLSALIELRYQVVARFYAFGRVAPGVLRGKAELHDPAPVVPLQTRFGALSVDASAGVAGRITDARTQFGVWLVAEGGYGWTPSHPLSLGPSFAAADSNKAGSLEIRDLAARGVFGRASVAFTY